MNDKEKWYKSTWFTILMLLFFFPLGLFLMWKFKPWKMWIKIAVTVLILVGAVNAMNNSNLPQNNTSNSTKSEEKADKKENTAKTESKEKKHEAKEDNKSEHKMNDTVKVDKLEFKVTNKQIVDQVGDVITNKAKGKFIVIDVTVKNNGDKAVDISDAFFKLKDEGKTFEADSAASTTANQAVSPDDLGFLGDKINPDSSKTGKVVFDVSQNIANKKGLTLQVQSGVFGTRTAKIELE